MAHPAPSTLAGEAVQIPDNRPDFIIGQYLTESDHGCSGRAMFNNPEEFAFGAMSPKPMVLKVPRRWI
jgi:hypothetical protein